MKKLLFLIASLCWMSFSYGQIVFTYGRHAVNADEFLKAYNKNKNTDTAGALSDYLQLYINFKLKVQAAKDLHLDTLPALQADLQNFRSQIEDNYLKDATAMNALVDEAFERSQKDIHVLHFFIASSELAADSQKNSVTLHKIEQQLNAKEKSIAEILAGIRKNENVTVQQSDLGFITVFTLPYDYENIIYKLKPGGLCAPCRTKSGWHIFKNVEERPAVGKIKLAQILLAIPPGVNNARATAKALADSVYKALKAGADFAEMAIKFSDDKLTYMDGGAMPEFGTAKYNVEFEKMAFSLTDDGEISSPFETEFGFHIIRQISRSPVPATKSDEAFMYYLKQEVLKDSRVSIAKKAFVAAILPKIGLKENQVNKNDIWLVTDSSLLANRNITTNGINEKTVLFSYNDQTKMRVSDWIQYLRNTNRSPSANLHESYKVAFPLFKETSSIDNYRTRLAFFNKDFKSQLEEFKDGNMLFEVMEREVWNKASLDSAGLLNYYHQHKEKYVWEASAAAVVFSCPDVNVANKIIEELNTGKSWKEVVKDYSPKVQADSARYELSQIPVVDRTNFASGLITAPVIDKSDGTVIFSKIYKVYPSHQQRSFEEARGQVVNDYQTLLEAKWIVQLKKRYPVKINKETVQSLLK